MATINLGSLKFNWTGAYNSGTSYAIDDVAQANGNSYVCIQAHSNQAVGNATAYWNIMSSAGTNGTNGTDLTSTLTAQGDMLYRDGSGLQRLAKGTASQELRMNSGATAPEWHTPAVATSDFVKLASATVTSGGSFNINGYFSSTYQTYKIFVSGVQAWHKMRFNFDANYGTYSGGNYVWVVNYASKGGSATGHSVSGGWNDSIIPMSYWSGDGSNEHHYAEITLQKPWDTSNRAKAIHVNAYNYDSSNVYVHQNSGFLDAVKYNEAVTGIHMFPTSGSMSDTSWELYGIK